MHLVGPYYVNIMLHVPQNVTEALVGASKETGLEVNADKTKYTGLFISPSGNSELDCATTKTDTAERSMSIGRESLQVFFFCTRDLGVLPGSTAKG